MMATWVIALTAVAMAGILKIAVAVSGVVAMGRHRGIRNCWLIGGIVNTEYLDDKIICQQMFAAKNKGGYFMKRSDLLIEKGEKIYSIGSTLCKILLWSVALLFATLLIAAMVEGAYAIIDCLIFNISSSYGFVTVIMAACYLGILVGSFGPMLYFNGLNLIGLGQIAKNTEKE